jgi:hypothetical protein
MINSKGKINGHVPTGGSGCFLVAVLQRVTEIEPGGKPLAIPQAYTAADTGERA